MDQTKRIQELEGAITEAGIALAVAWDADTVPSEIVKQAMRNLGKVMSDESVLRRQGI